MDVGDAVDTRVRVVKTHSLLNDGVDREAHLVLRR